MTVSVETAVYDVWYVVQKGRAWNLGLYQHQRVKNGTRIFLPEITDVHGYRHLSWKSDDWPKGVDHAIGDEVMITRDCIYYLQV